MRSDRSAVNKALLHDEIATQVAEPLTPKAQAFVEAFTTHPELSHTAVARIAGYQGPSAKVNASLLLKQPKIRKAIATAFKKLGMTPEYWAWRLKGAAEATLPHSEDPDHKTRLTATRIALELRGAFDAPPPAAVQAGIGQVTVNLGFKSGWTKDGGGPSK